MDLEVSRRIEILSKLFRMVLSNDSDFTTIREEIEYTENYLFFQQQYYKENINVIWDIDESLVKFKTIKLILQPIVENCIVHTMNRKIVKLTIKIRLRDEGEDILIEVEDDGIGADNRYINQILNSRENPKKHIALRNINKRLKGYYGKEYGLRINAVNGIGTKVFVRLPKIVESQDEDAGKVAIG
jgi:two-component system sensor histidine kinase YesM